MLVLSRLRDQNIRLTLMEDLPAGTEIDVTALDIRGDRVRLGLSAPASVRILRQEILDAIQRQNTEQPLG